MTITLSPQSLTVTPFSGVLDTRAPNGVPLPTPNEAPVISGAPTSAVFSGDGPHTLAFAPYCTDPNDDNLAYSLSATRTGITINASTGLITMSTAAANSVGDVTIDVSDGTLTTQHTLNIAISPAATGGALDYHPGHYITTSGNNIDTGAIDAVVNYVNARSYLKGVVIRPFWRQLETSLGVYDFSLIDYALAALNTDKYFWLQIQTARFNAPAEGPADILPAYLVNATYDGGAYDDGTHVKTKVWNVNVMDRKIALIQALATQYNNTAKFEGVVTGETAMSIANGEGTSNYTATALSTQLQRLFPAARAAFTKKQLLVYVNFISGSGSSSQFQPILNAARSADYVVGGPDSLYLNPATGRDYINGTLGTTNYRGRMGIQVGDQNSGLNNASYVIANLFNTCFTASPGGWGGNYGFWQYDTGSVNFNNIMSYISANSPAVVTTYPSEFPT